jgi:hypothetical protein
MKELCFYPRTMLPEEISPALSRVLRAEIDSVINYLQRLIHYTCLHIHFYMQ